MNSLPQTPIRPAARLESLPPYTPIEPFEVLSARLGRLPEQIIKLDANENPYGPSPRARQALARLDYPHIYPDPESRLLRAALSRFNGVPVEALLAGSGSDELIDLLLRVLLEPGDRVLICPPTFGMYAFDTRLNAGQLVEAPRRPDFSLDLEAIEQVIPEQRPKILFLANPNNPDGSLLPPEVLDRLLDLPLLVVLDEAYIEFTGQGRLGEHATRITQVPERQNLVVLRTFSKWAGLAGLRVGYGAFPGWLLPALWKAKQPYNVNVAASAAAIASLEDQDHLAETVERLRQERRRMSEVLARFPFLQPYPSHANFVLARVLAAPSGCSAAELKRFLAEDHGILVRYFNSPGLQDHIRISAGQPESTGALVAALQQWEAGRAAAASGERAARSPEPQQAAQFAPPQVPPRAPRRAVVDRSTRETRIHIELDLDGQGQHAIQTGVGFLDHMLTHLAVHGLFDLTVEAEGDLHIDVHHTVEDVALALGAAFDQALGDRAGLVRMGSATVPMDECLAFVALDLSGRPYAVVDVDWHSPAVGGIPTSLFPHFLESFAFALRSNLHARVLYGRDDHHQAEAIFKALAHALGAATRLDPRRLGAIPSTKGTLTA